MNSQGKIELGEANPGAPAAKEKMGQESNVSFGTVGTRGLHEGEGDKTNTRKGVMTLLIGRPPRAGKTVGAKRTNKSIGASSVGGTLHMNLERGEV